VARRVVVAACWIATLTALVTVVGGFGRSSTGNPTGASVDQAFDKIWAKYGSQLVGTCMGAVDGNVRVTKCFGSKGAGSSARPDSNTLFLIDSITKTFAGTLLALRVHQHSVGLDDPVKNYLSVAGGRNAMPAAVTLHELADHHSGMPRKSPSGAALNVNLFLLQASACLSSSSCRASEPGQTYLYSNWAFGVLGDVLALHDGFQDGPLGPWEQDNSKSIAQPLGMTSTKTWLGWQHSDPISYQARRAIAGGTDHWSGQPYTDAAGGLYSSAHDMLIWLRYSMGLTGPANLLAARHLLYEGSSLVPPNAAKQTGLAWQVATTSGGAKCVSKDGGGLGFTSYIVFVDGQKRGAFVLLDNSPAPKVSTIAKDLLNTLPPTPGAAAAKC
jgi:D-alanyl-D-alanine-carboxypeptidase/D-alanyl-D-alanine-endopeptidase